MPALVQGLVTEQVFRKLENVAYAMGIDAAII